MKGSRSILALAGAAAAAFVLALLPSSALAALTPPSPASPNADDTQLAYVIMVGLTTILALAAIVGLIAAARGRGRRSETEAGEGSLRRTRGTDAVQRRVGLALGGMALAIFIFGLVVTGSAREVDETGADGLTTAQKDLALPAGSPPLEINVSGQQWLWRFEYPDGTFSYHELVVPVDTAVVLDVESTDVLHRWWVPELGGMFDAVPGQSNETWFKAEETGTYEGQSTAFSGPAYAQMRARVTVLEPAEYEAWLGEQAAAIKEAQGVIQERVEAGDTLAVELEAAPEGAGADGAEGEQAAAGEAGAAAEEGAAAAEGEQAE